MKTPAHRGNIQLSEKLYKSIIDNLYDGVVIIDTQGRITYWNRGAEQITGYLASEVVGRICDEDILVRLDSRGRKLCGTGMCPRQMVVTGRFPKRPLDQVYFRHKDGHRIPVLSRVIPIVDKHNRTTGLVEIFSDNRSQVLARQRINELQRLALLDPLTGLGNRRYTEIFLRARLDELQRYNWPFGIMLMDLDNFKTINDEYGHDVGDETLRMVAQTARNSVRSSDVVGRWGGDELVAIVTNVSRNELYTVAEKVRQLVEQSGFEENRDVIPVTVSIGATAAGLDDTVLSLLRRADEFMYMSKHNGGNTVWTPDGRLPLQQGS